MKVAIAIISDQQDRILITQRPYHVSHGGFWEFPGGKLEKEETGQQALIREIREELGLEIQECQFLGQIKHEYTEKTIELLVYQVIRYTGKPLCLEGQVNMKWAKKKDINPKEFPEANSFIFDLIGINKEITIE